MFVGTPHRDNRKEETVETFTILDMCQKTQVYKRSSYRVNAGAIQLGLTMVAYVWMSSPRRQKMIQRQTLPIGWIEQPTSPLRVARSTTELNGHDYVAL